jgi:hypothetical protein
LMLSDNVRLSNDFIGLPGILVRRHPAKSGDIRYDCWYF